MIKILFVCHGNICRSQMGEAMMKYIVKQQGLADKFFIDSAGTSSEELGNPMYHMAVMKLNEYHIPIGNHRARKMTYHDYQDFDFILCMDENNYRSIMRLSDNDPQNKVHKILTFTGSNDDVADPWYTRNFEITYQQLDKSIREFIGYLGF